MNFQIVPVILSGAGLFVLVYLVLTLLFGRFYCSMICPAGILQDIFNRLSCIGKKKKNGSRRFRYHQPSNWLRYLIIAATTLLAIFGLTELLLLPLSCRRTAQSCLPLFILQHKNRPRHLQCMQILRTNLQSRSNRFAKQTHRHISMRCLFQLYLLKPHMSYEHSYCNYTCTVCSVVCPNHAIQPITEAQKKVTQIGLANFYRGRCIVHTEGTDCGACVEHCPMQAVHMVPYRGTLTIPKVEKELCIGCGACESICPVTPHRAIQVIANPIHLTAELPPEEEIQKINPVDFGFLKKNLERLKKSIPLPELLIS